MIAREIDVEDVGAVTARERPDVALVGLGESSEHALALIDKIVREAACPVIVLIHARDPDFVKEASKRGVFAHISDADVEDWQSSIDIVLRRFAEYHDLEGAFGRRALIERAKGILMERHGVDEASAFEMLREQSRDRQPQARRPRGGGRRRPPPAARPGAREFRVSQSRLTGRKLLRCPAEACGDRQPIPEASGTCRRRASRLRGAAPTSWSA